MIITSYFIGYFLFGIPGGYLAYRFSARSLIGLTLTVASYLNILVPISSRTSWSLLIACRFAIGACHGAMWPAFASFWTQWAPPSERSRLIGWGFAGVQLGYAVTEPLGDFLCDHGFDGGWPSMFYIFGSVGFVWFIIWMVQTSDMPTDQRSIVDRERDYIEAETKESHKIKHAVNELLFL